MRRLRQRRRDVIVWGFALPIVRPTSRRAQEQGGRVMKARLFDEQRARVGPHTELEVADGVYVIMHHPNDDEGGTVLYVYAGPCFTEGGMYAAFQRARYTHVYGELP